MCVRIYFLVFLIMEWHLQYKLFKSFVEYNENIILYFVLNQAQCYNFYTKSDRKMRIPSVVCSLHSLKLSIITCLQLSV